MTDQQERRTYGHREEHHMSTTTEPHVTLARRFTTADLTNREKQAVRFLAEIVPEPGDVSNEKLCRDDSNVWVHWRTAESLVRKGFARIHDWETADAHIVLVGYATECTRCPGTTDQPQEDAS